MTLRLTMLTRLIAKIVGDRSVGLRTMSTCAFATLLATQANAQLTDGLVFPNEMPIGSAAVNEGVLYTENASVLAQAGDTAGVYVGPGGPTSFQNVPSNVTPEAPAGQRTRLVNQPWPSGPFVQSQPTYQDAGIPCPCDEGCDFSYYGSAEALYFRREHDERFSLSQFGLPPFDYEWAGRVTLGRVVDCVDGYEVVYAGPFKWDREMAASSAGGNLQSRLTPSGVVPATISSFNNATFHSQSYQARLNTFELNRRWWAWDVFSLLVGLRVVDYRENYSFASVSAAGPGLLQDSTRNRMFGPQIGGEINQPLGLRTLLGFRGKGALLGNFSRNEVALQNAGASVLNVSDSDVDVAGLIEMGAYVKYSVTPSIRLTGGYEFWYLPQVATVADQGLNIISPGLGSKVRAEEDLLLHGFSMGAQVLY